MRTSSDPPGDRPGPLVTGAVAGGAGTSPKAGRKCEGVILENGSLVAFGGGFFAPFILALRGEQGKKESASSRARGFSTRLRRKPGTGQSSPHLLRGTVLHADG